MQMTESVKKEPSKKLTLRKRTVETYVSCAVRGIMNTKARLRQKKEKFIRSVPWLNKIDRKCRAFDLRMERKYGQVYTKLRDSTKNIARTVLAAKLFGVPGCRRAKPLWRNRRNRTAKSANYPNILRKTKAKPDSR